VEIEEEGIGHTIQAVVLIAAMVAAAGHLALEVAVEAASVAAVVVAAAADLDLAAVLVVDGDL